MRRHQVIMIVFLTGFFSTQFYHTITHKVHWPFNPMNLFHSLAKFEQKVYYFRVIDDQNNSYLVHSKYIIPLEQFRIKGVLDKVFGSKNLELERKYLKILVDKLNYSPVRFTLNEMEYSFRPPNNQKIIGLALEEHYFDTREYIYGHKHVPINIKQRNHEDIFIRAR